MKTNTGKKAVQAKKSTVKKEPAAPKAKKTASKKEEDEVYFDGDEEPVDLHKKTALKNDSDDDDEPEDDPIDEIEEDEFAVDKDFEEFDIPKSKTKSTGTAKKGKTSDDLEIDEDFKDLGLDDFGGGSGDFDDEDDF